MHSRLADLLMFIGMLVLLASIGLLSAMLADWEQANGSHRMQKLTVNVDRSVSTSNPLGLELKDAEQLAENWSPLPIAFSAKGQTRAVFGNNSVVCEVIGVSGNYRNFTELRMKAGTSISAISVDEHSRVAVLSAKVADKLFHSEQVVGKTIELYGAAFTIIGVYDDEGSLLRQMAEDGIPDVLIPITSMLDMNPNTKIDTLHLAAKKNSANGESEAKVALMDIGKNPSQFQIQNDALTFTQSVQLRDILLFCCGVIAILMLVRLMVWQFKYTYEVLQRKLAAYDWQDAIKIERKLLLTSGLYALGMLACMVALLELIRFRLYIPPDWVPAELIDLSFYMDKLRSLWQQQAIQAGYVPSPQERLADAASTLGGRLFLAGIVIGLPLCLLSARLWAIGRVPVHLQLQKVFLYLPVIAAIILVIAKWAGLDYRIIPTEYVVLSLLFIVSSIHSNTRSVSHVEIND